MIRHRQSNIPKKSQLGSAVTEYLPIVALIAIAAVRVVWGEYGTALQGQGATLSTQLAGSPSQSGFGDGSTPPLVGGQGYDFSGGGTGARNGGAPGPSNANSGSGSPSSGNSGANNTGNGANNPSNPNSNNDSDNTDGSPGSPGGNGVAGTGNNGNNSGSENNANSENNSNDNNNVVTQEETDESILAQAAQFAGGLATGLRTQFRGLVELVTNPIESAQALFKLAESLVRDPVGTLSTIAEEIGEDIAAVASGDPHEVGRVIGENVSPAALFRIVSKLSDIARATRRLDTGCSSFMEGTLVWTEDGLMPIEQIAVGTEVLARSDASFEDEYQPVKQLFTREAAYYYTLSTGFDEIHVTAEHPFWVQGEGWVNAEHLTAGSAIATANGDILVRTITRNDTPITVYNFEVETDHTYFVSDNGLWVHNSNVVCDLSSRNQNRINGVPTIDVETSRATRGSPEFELLNNPPPNTRVRLDNGTTFVTNSGGFVEEISFTPSLSRGTRDARQTAVGREGINGDVGGHIQACRLGGTCDRFNLFPQNSNFNNGAYRVWENEIARQLENGADVGPITVRFTRADPNNPRPDSLQIDYVIDGQIMVERFRNQPGG